MANPPSAPPELRRGSSAEVIARHVRNDIEAGRMYDGEQLPSTKELAHEWETSTHTISRAMNLLESEGLVINRPRSSRIVRYAPAEPEPIGQWVTNWPQVILIGGFAGSGKTELARILARYTHWAILDKDSTTRAVVEAALEECGCSPHDRESATYWRLIRPAEYEALLAAASENVECGSSVIVSAPFINEFADRAWCKRVAALMESLDAELHIIWIYADTDSMRTYLRRRGAARDMGKLSDWQGYLDSIDLDLVPATEHYVVWNNTDSRPLQDQAREFLRKAVTG
jgi:predicted kinase